MKRGLRVRMYGLKHDNPVSSVSFSRWSADPNSSLKVTRGSISFRNSSVFGMNQVSTPLANIGAFVGGYKKPFWALVFSFFMLFGVLFGMGEGSGGITVFFAVLALLGLLFYYLQKTMFMGFETSGGGTYGFAFKASVLEGVGVDIKRVESTIAYVNSLISSASLGETFVEQAQTQALGGRQATMLATSAPAAAPMVQTPAQARCCCCCRPSRCARTCSRSRPSPSRCADTSSTIACATRAASAER